MLRVRDAKLCMVAVFGIILVVEIEQKQAIWCLKHKSLNKLLVFLIVKSKTTGLCNHGDFFEKNGILPVMLTYYIKLYKSKCSASISSIL